MPLDVIDRFLRPLRRGPATSGYPAVTATLPPAARRLPVVDATRCEGSAACVTACPTAAIAVAPGTWSVDAGACVLCGACARACPAEAIAMTGPIELAADRREALVVVRSREGGA
jgi:formate hydrogenlyase subunit 6/NADH:ubiquinone oxidoreductase subunit I